MFSFIELLPEVHAQIVKASPPTKSFSTGPRKGCRSDLSVCFMNYV